MLRLTSCNKNATLSRMKSSPSRKGKKDETWPKKVTIGRETVSIYRRSTPRGNHAFMVANYSNPKKRRFDSYPTEEEAIEQATTLAKRMSERDSVAASMTHQDAMDYASAVQSLSPSGVGVAACASAVAECLKIVQDLAGLHAACRFYAARHRQVIKKTVSEVVGEMLVIKESRGASLRYMQDLRYRLKRFAKGVCKEAGNVTTAEIQEWLDGQGLSPQGYTNFRRVLLLLFKFAVARSYAIDNPVEGADRVKIRSGDAEIFTPVEIARLLAAASADFLPSLAIGAFAGLRSAEIERLQWSDVDLAGRHITVGASRAKTASRRIVPICDNLAAWLAPYARRQGSVWPGEHDAFYETQQETASATAIAADEENDVKAQKAVGWKSNALRHSYASYRFAQTGDAGRVAGELGNSAAVVHRHYRELVKPADAERWFSVKPASPENLVSLPAAASA